MSRISNFLFAAATIGRNRNMGRAAGLIGIDVMDRVNFNLRLWFGITASGIIAVLAATFALLMSNFITDTMLQREVQVTREFLESIIDAEGAAGHLFATEAMEKNEQIAEFAYHIRSMPDVLRANIYGWDRSVLWSTDQAMIGKHFRENPELEEAFAGSLVSEVGRLADSN